MGCKYSMEEINNFFEGNMSLEDSNAAAEHIKSCENCRVYYSSLVITEKLINNSENPKTDIYGKIENFIDKNRYTGSKKLLYRLSNLFSTHRQILKPAVIAVLICFLAVFAIKYGGQLSNLVNDGNKNTTVGSKSGIIETMVKDSINKAGGISSKLILEGENGTKPSEEELLKAKEVIDKRLNNIGLTEHITVTDNSNSCLNITAAWANNQNDMNFENTLKELVKKGSFTFQETDEKQKDNNGLYLPTGKIIISNKDIIRANLQKDPNSNGKVILLTFNEEGIRKFSEATGRLLMKPIAVFMDDQLIIAPTVNSQITNGSAIINGIHDPKKLDITLALLNSGTLSVKVTVKEFKAFEPGTTP